MTHEKLAERIVEHLRAVNHRHEGDEPRTWTGDNASQIHWGTRAHVNISSSLSLSNSLSGGRYSCSLDLFHRIEQAKALVLSRGWQDATSIRIHENAGCEKSAVASKKPSP